MTNPIEQLRQILLANQGADSTLVISKDLASLITQPTALPDAPVVVAVIDEEGEHFKETVVIHRPGIDSLPVGTELVDRIHVTRLREDLATAKRNEHNSEVAYKAAIERQDELREDLAAIINNRNELKERLTATEQRNADLVELLRDIRDAPGGSSFNKHIDVALKPTESGASE